MSSYVPQQHALEFISFLRATGNEENVSPEVHYRIADSLFSSDKQDRKILIECTRGLGKSTVAEYAVIYAAALGQWPGFGKVPFVVFLGASQEGNVRQFMKNIANKIDRSPFLRTVLKVVRQTDNELELVNADGVEMSIAGRGMSTNFRGLRSKGGARPTLLIADDVLSSEMMTSEALRNTVNTNWYNSVLPALDPMRHKVIFIGTPISEDDLLAQIKSSGTFRVERYPLCTSFPCPESEFNSIWPDRFSYDYTKDMYKQYEAAGKTAAFYMEYLLEVTDLTSRLVDPEDIRWYDPDQVVKNKSNYNYYISTDFATSTKKSADYSAIAVWAINANGDWMLVDGVCVRQTMQDNLEDLFRLVQKWKPISVGIESSGQQGGFISILEDMMFKRNVWFNLARKATQLAEEATKRAELAKSEGMIEAANRLESIVSVLNVASESLSAQIEQSSRGAEEQSAASEEISHAIEQVANISEETSTSMGHASKAVSELLTQSQELQRLIRELKG
jgi:hypothetical protein